MTATVAERMPFNGRRLVLRDLRRVDGDGGEGMKVYVGIGPCGCVYFVSAEFNAEWVKRALNRGDTVKLMDGPVTIGGCCHEAEKGGYANTKKR